MGKNTYNGGGTIVHPGSGFFSHKGGPGRKRKPSDGGDKPGPAKAGSICDFGPLPSKRKRIVEFDLKRKRQGAEDRHEVETKRLRATAKSLVSSAENLARQKNAQIGDLKVQLARTERELETLRVALTLARTIDLGADQLKEATAKLDSLLRPLVTSAPKRKDKSPKKPAKRKKSGSAPRAK